MASNLSQDVMKGRSAFVIPGGLCDRHASLGMERVPKESNQAVKAEEHGRCAVDSKVGPLALGFDSQVGSALLKGGF